MLSPSSREHLTNLLNSERERHEELATQLADLGQLLLAKRREWEGFGASISGLESVLADGDEKACGPPPHRSVPAAPRSDAPPRR
jgi:hypothetical protein